jgi:hypothetical protein
MKERSSQPAAEVRRLFEEAESRTAKRFEEAVSRGSFGELLARTTENLAAITKIGTDVFDLMLRNLRLAGRQDVTRLARQLNRTEDKLELVLQEVELLDEELERAREEPRARRAHTSGTRRGRPSNGRAGGGSRRGARTGNREST